MAPKQSCTWILKGKSEWFGFSARKKQQSEPCLQELSLLWGSRPRNVVVAHTVHSKDFSSLAESLLAPFLHTVVPLTLWHNVQCVLTAATTKLLPCQAYSSFAITKMLKSWNDKTRPSLGRAPTFSLWENTSHHTGLQLIALFTW